MAVKEWNDEIVFVRQVTPGASGKSFGIQVARLAGLPDGVVNRAKEILSTLESGDSDSSPDSDPISAEHTGRSANQEETMAISPKPSKRKLKPDPSQLELF